MSVIMRNDIEVGGTDDGIIAKVGTDTLDTTAQDLSGAVNELNSKIGCPFPVGYVYMSVTADDPSTLFPNTTWERIQDTFLLASGSTYSAGSTGGTASVNTGVGVSVTGGNITYTPAGTNKGTAVTMNAIELTHSGGAVKSHTLTINEIPSHNHDQKQNIGPAPVISGTGGINGYLWGNENRQYYTGDTGGGKGHTHDFTQPSKHSFTPSTKSVTQPTFTGTKATLTHSHTVSVTNQDLDNMPPYLTVYMWKRTA